MSKKIKLGEYCDIIKGDIGIQKAIPGEYPLVVTAEERLSHNEFQFDNTAVIIPLVSSTGHGHASLKRIHYQEGKFALGTILCAVIIKDANIINPRYLYIYLSYFKDHLLVPLMKGAANVTLSIKKIKEVEIILPSLERQLEIIELEKNNCLVKELESEIQTQKQLLTQLKQSILQEAIQGKLTSDWRASHPELVSGSHSAEALLKRIKAEKAQLIKDKKIKKEKALPPITTDEIPFELPVGWVWCRLGDICNNITSGSTPSKESFNSTEIPYLKVYNIRNQKIDFDYKPQFIKKSIHESSLKRCILKPNDVVMNIVGPPLGKVAVIPEQYPEWNCNQAIAIFRCIDANVNPFIYQYLCAGLYLDYLHYKGMAGQDNISVTMCKELVIGLPSLSEQKAIVEKVETLMRNCQALEQEIKTSEANAQMLMQAVLKEAFLPTETPMQASESKQRFVGV